MATSLLACFGTNGKGVGCYDRRAQTHSDGTVTDGPFEHPRGRACDFMMTDGGVANGAEKARGTAFAEYVEAHAQELHVIYIIWFNKNWDPHDGNIPWSQWRSYGCSGSDPSSCHYNHVHVSVHFQPGDPPLARCVPGIPCTM